MTASENHEDKNLPRGIRSAVAGKGYPLARVVGRVGGRFLSSVWVRLNSIDCKAGLGVRKLTLHGNPDPSGDQTANFKVTEPFVFLAPH